MLEKWTTPGGLLFYMAARCRGVLGRSWGPRLWEIAAVFSWLWMHGRPWAEDCPHTRLRSLERPPCAIIDPSMNMDSINRRDLQQDLCRRWESTTCLICCRTYCTPLAFRPQTPPHVILAHRSIQKRVCASGLGFRVGTRTSRSEVLSGKGAGGEDQRE